MACFSIRLAGALLFGCWGTAVGVERAVRTSSISHPSSSSSGWSCPSRVISERYQTQSLWLTLNGLDESLNLFGKACQWYSEQSVVLAGGGGVQLGRGDHSVLHNLKYLCCHGALPKVCDVTLLADSGARLSRDGGRVIALLQHLATANHLLRVASSRNAWQ